MYNYCLIKDISYFLLIYYLIHKCELINSPI